MGGGKKEGSKTNIIACKVFAPLCTLWWTDVLLVFSLFKLLPRTHGSLPMRAWLSLPTPCWCGTALPSLPRQLAVATALALVIATTVGDTAAAQRGTACRAGGVGAGKKGV